MHTYNVLAIVVASLLIVSAAAPAAALVGAAPLSLEVDAEPLPALPLSTSAAGLRLVELTPDSYTVDAAYPSATLENLTLDVAFDPESLPSPPEDLNATVLYDRVSIALLEGLDPGDLQVFVNGQPYEEVSGSAAPAGPDCTGNNPAFWTAFVASESFYQCQVDQLLHVTLGNATRNTLENVTLVFPAPISLPPDVGMHELTVWLSLSGNGLDHVTGQAIPLSNEQTLPFEVLPGAGHSLQAVSGAGQTATVTEPLAEPLVARVVDVLGNNVTGHQVCFDFVTVPDGSEQESVEPACVATDADGLAQTNASLGTKIGNYVIHGTAEDVDGDPLVDSPAVYPANALPGAGSTILFVSALPQAANADDPDVLVTFRVEDDHQNPVAGQDVDAELSGPAGGSLSEVMDNDDGTYTTILTTTRTAGDEFTVTAHLLDEGGATLDSATSDPIGVVPGALAIEYLSASTLTPSADDPSVEVTFQVGDAHGNLVSGENVTASFAGPEGGSLGPVTDNGDGTYTVTLTTTTSAGDTFTVNGTLRDAAGDLVDEATSDAIVVQAGSPAALEIVGGDGQERFEGQQLEDPLVARVTDAHGNPVAGVTVVFDVTAEPAPGSGALLLADTVLTDADGNASTEFVLGETAGNYTIEADAEDGAGTSLGLTGAPVQFTATALLSTPTHFTVDCETLEPVAGESFDCTVAAIRQDGGVATGYVGTVNFTTTAGSAPGGAGPVLPMNYTFMTEDAGERDFPFTLHRAEDGVSVSVTDVSDGAINGTQAGINVTAAAESSLLVTCDPAMLPVLAEAACDADLADAFGNALAEPVPNWSATAGSFTEFQGFATTYVAPGTPGEVTVTAAAGAVTDNVTLNVTVGALSSLLFENPSGSRVNVSADDASAPVRVRALDAEGNAIPDMTVFLELFVGDTTGSLTAASAITGPDGWAEVVLTTSDLAGDEYRVRAEDDPDDPQVTRQSGKWAVVAGDPHALDLACSPCDVTAGDAFDLLGTVRDANGNAVAILQGEHTMRTTGASGSPGGFEPTCGGAGLGTDFPVVVTNGTLANVPCTFYKNETVTLLAELDLESGATLSSTVLIEVSAAAAHQLNFTRSVNALDAGDCGRFDVSIQDLFGNLQPNGWFNVSLAADAEALYGAPCVDGTQIDEQAYGPGVHTRTLYFRNESAIHAVTIDASATGLAPASHTFANQPGPPAQLEASCDGPCSFVAGETFEVDIEAQDQFGNALGWGEHGYNGTTTLVFGGHGDPPAGEPSPACGAEVLGSSVDLEFSGAARASTSCTLYNATSADLTMTDPALNISGGVAVSVAAADVEAYTIDPPKSEPDLEVEQVTTHTVNLWALDPFGNPVSGHVVYWTVLPDALNEGTASLSAQQGTTDGAGLVQVNVTVSHAVGDKFRVRGTNTTDPGCCTSAIFATTARFAVVEIDAGPAANGTLQSEPIAGGLALITLTVEDGDGKPVSGFSDADFAVSIDGAARTLLSDDARFSGFEEIVESPGTYRVEFADSGGTYLFDVWADAAGVDALIVDDAVVVIEDAVATTLTLLVDPAAYTLVGHHITSESGQNLRVRLRDQFGDPMAGHTVVATADPGPLDGGSAEAGTNSNGVATFADVPASRLAIDVASVHNLTFAVGALSVTSQDFEVFLPAINITAVGNPSFADTTLEAAAGGPIVVTLTDPADGPVAGVSVVINLNIVVGTGFLTGTTTQLTNATGQAVFDDLAIDDVGIYELEAIAMTVTESSDTFSVWSVNVTDVADPSVVSTALEADGGGSITVTVVDENLAAVVGATVDVTLDAVSGSGTLSGTLTQVTDATGVAEFADLEIDAAGDYRLEFTVLGRVFVTNGFAVS